MAKIWTRGGVRLAVEDGEFVVYVDAAKLADASEFDTPEVELARISKEDAVAELRRFVANVKAEARRFNKRRKKGSKK